MTDIYCSMMKIKNEASQGAASEESGRQKFLDTGDIDYWRRKVVCVVVPCMLLNGIEHHGQLLYV